MNLQKPQFILFVFLLFSGLIAGRKDPLPMDVRVWTLTQDTVITNDILHPEKPTFIYFWATWCHVCAKDMPKMESLVDEFGDDVHFISISHFDKRTSLEKILSKKPDFMDTYLDGIDRLFGAAGIPATPTVMIIDSDRNTIYKGYGGKRKYKSVIKKLLKD